MQLMRRGSGRSRQCSYHVLPLVWLLRLGRGGLCDTISDYAGADCAPPPRSYTEEEQRALVPRLAAVALGLVEQDLLTVHEMVGPLGKTIATVLVGSELHEVLTEPANWLWPPDPARRFTLGAPQPVREYWFDGAYPTADTSGLPTWDELSLPQWEVLVCAAESSGMLTGPFGIWQDPPADLDATGRLAWIDRQLDPLLPFVLDGWIEVQHHPDAHSDAYTVIRAEHLRSALDDPSIRYEGDDWGVGVGCIFTYTGLAIWRGGWSRAWSKRMILD